MNPLLENLDIREKGIGILSKSDQKCSQCEYLNNYSAFRCYNCNNLFGTFAFNYKRGNKTYGSNEVKKLDDEFNTNYKDYIQPTKWNNVTRKIETNPEFVKNYGNPWKERNDFGSETRKQLNVLTKVDENAKTNLINPK